MKARLKETGIIIELDEYCYDLDGNEYKWDELDLMTEPDWSSFRREAAKDILCSVLAGGVANGATGFDAQSEILVSISIQIADELIAKLKEK
jgi:hypothetical protein